MWHFDGDVRGAVRLLCSSEQGVQPDTHSYGLMQKKHPTRPPDRRKPPTVLALPPLVTSEDVLRAIKSFPLGSSGGIDGLRPQHLLDLLDKVVSSTLAETMLDFVNLVLSGGVPLSIRSIFFGGRLFSLSKPGGGLRPIAIGMTLRRLVAKIANRVAVNKCSHYLTPRQLGVGVKGGCEAVVHAARAFLISCPAGSALLKIDFNNAFNTLRRDSMLEAVQRHIP